jgi:RecA/RadA recombinase
VEIRSKSKSKSKRGRGRGEGSGQLAALPAEVLELRRQLERRFPDAQPVREGTTGGVGTGVGVLDAALPAGGLPRGRVTLWRPGGGATTVLRSACGEVVRGGERAAWVDGAGLVAGAYWAGGVGGVGGEVGRGRSPALFRPGRPLAPVVAEELLRSGGFALVVLVLGGVGLGDGEGVRLGRGAREGGAAFVLVGGGAPVTHLRVRSSFDAAGFEWRRGPFGEPVSLESVAVRARLQSMGLDRKVRFRLPVDYHDVRLSLEPRLVDRRGVRR